MTVITCLESRMLQTNRRILDTWRLGFSKNGYQSHTVLERACEKRKSEIEVDIDRDDD